MNSFIDLSSLTATTSFGPRIKVNEHFAIDSVDLKYNVGVTLRDRDGNVVDSNIGHNLIMDNGKLELVKRLCGDSAGTLNYCAVGTGGVAGDPFTPIAPVSTATALNAEVFRSTFTSKTYGLSGASNVVLSTIFLSTAVNNIISEAGLFMAVTGGVMFARYTFPSMYLKMDRGFSLAIDWTIQF